MTLPPTALGGGGAAVTRCTDTLNNTAGGLLATKNASTLRLFLYNHPTMSSTTGLPCAMTVALPAGAALAAATLGRIDETHANPKVAMGGRVIQPPNSIFYR